MYRRLIQRFLFLPGNLFLDLFFLFLQFFHAQFQFVDFFFRSDQLFIQCKILPAERDRAP